MLRGHVAVSDQPPVRTVLAAGEHRPIGHDPAFTLPDPGVAVEVELAPLVGEVFGLLRLLHAEAGVEGRDDA